MLIMWVSKRSSADQSELKKYLVPDCKTIYIYVHRWPRGTIRRHSSSIPWPTRAMNILKLKFSRFVVSAKFQGVMRVFHHPNLLRNYQTFYSNLFALSIL